MEMAGDLFAADEVEGLDMLGGGGFESGGARQMMARESANIASHARSMRNKAPASMRRTSAPLNKKKKARGSSNLFGAAPGAPSLPPRPEYE